MNVDTSIFKAYDIRATFPDQINADIAYRIGQGYAEYVKPQKEVLVGHDVRIHSEELKLAIISGLTDAGVNVVDAGLLSTDMYYFGVGFLDLGGGLQSTASHNPPEWHGVKMVREKVIPLTGEMGIYQIRDFVAGDKKLINQNKGSVRKINILEDYCRFVLKWIDPAKIKPMKVVYNPNFGYAGKVFEHIVEMGKLPLTLIPLNAEPDGTFPKGRPDPFVPENRVEFLALIKSSGADLGVTWDADADRAFFAADGGEFVETYFANTLIIKSLLKKHPGEKIIYDPRYTWAYIETIEQNGGIAIPIRVGHSYIKQAMRENNAAFASESSGHTYYRDYWYADCGMIPVLQMLEYLSEENTKLSEAIKPIMSKYFVSGEINQKVADPKALVEKIASQYADAKQSRIDGISIEYPEYRFNVRTSNTEPLLRLCLEARSKELMEQKRDEVLALIRS